MMSLRPTPKKHDHKPSVEAELWNFWKSSSSRFLHVGFRKQEAGGQVRISRLRLCVCVCACTCVCVRVSHPECSVFFVLEEGVGCSFLCHADPSQTHFLSETQENSSVSTSHTHAGRARCARSAPKLSVSRVN